MADDGVLIVVEGAVIEGDVVSGSELVNSAHISPHTTRHPRTCQCRRRLTVDQVQLESLTPDSELLGVAVRHRFSRFGRLTERRVLRCVPVYANRDVVVQPVYSTDIDRPTASCLSHARQVR